MTNDEDEYGGRRRGFPLLTIAIVIVVVAMVVLHVTGVVGPGSN